LSPTIKLSPPIKNICDKFLVESFGCGDKIMETKTFKEIEFRIKSNIDNEELTY